MSDRTQSRNILNYQRQLEAEYANAIRPEGPETVEDSSDENDEQQETFADNESTVALEIGQQYEELIEESSFSSDGGENNEDRSDVEPISGSLEDYLLEEEMVDTDDHLLTAMFDVKKLGNSNFSLQECLRIWAVLKKVPREVLEPLLHILKFKANLDLPQSSETLLKTPRKKITPRSLTKGEYQHFSLENQLKNASHDFLLDPSNDVIDLDIGMDGLPPFKSSPKVLFPILGAFTGKPKISPFIIGSYFGVGDPADADEFLEPFVDEASKLIIEGFEIRPGIKKRIKIHHIGCDSPAKAFVKRVKYHTGKSSCHFCNQLAKSLHRRMVFETSVGEPRTDSSFRNRTHPEHHSPESMVEQIALEKLPGIDMVKSFPPDPMHLLDLGVLKHFTISLFSNKLYGYQFTLQELIKISETYVSWTKYVPAEFGRKPRNLKHLSFFKSLEFRLLGLYILPSLLDHPKVHDNVYMHFLKLHFAYRLVSCPNPTPEQLLKAKELFEAYVAEAPNIFGPDFITFNLHNLLHIYEACLDYGSVNNFSNYKFENYLQILKQLIRKPEKVLQQLHKRIFELTEVEQLIKAHLNGENGPFGAITNSDSQITHRGYKFDSFILNNNIADSCCCVALENGDVAVIIDGFGTIDSERVVFASRFDNLVPFYKDEYFDSQEYLGIVIAGSLSTAKEIFPVSKIKYKFFRIPYQNGFLLYPLLHHL